jgi:hypothetical protein
MADTYRGTATLIVDSMETPVVADLMAGFDEGGWLGVLDGDPSEEFWSFARGGAGKIRLPDGREGHLVPGQPAYGTGRVAVTGTGEPPF